MIKKLLIMKKLLFMLTVFLSVATTNFSSAQAVSAVNTTAPGVCDGYAVLVDSVNVNPTSIYWASSGAVIQQGGYYVSGLCAGTYTVTYTNGSGMSQTYTFIIQDGAGNPCSGFYADVITTAVTDTVACDGAIDVFPYGGSAPYTYSWGSPTFGSSSSVTGICPGSYYCVVTDAAGCTYTVQCTVIDSTNNGGNPCSGFYAGISVYPSSDSLSCDGSMEIVPYGGTAPYTYSLASGVSYPTGTITDLCPGTYTVVVVDGNGCYYTVSGSVLDSSYYFPDSSNIISNPTFGDSTIVDTLDYSWIYDCTFDLSSIDSAYVIQNSSLGSDSVLVTWIMIDAAGQVVGTYTVGYPTGGVSGVVTVYLSVLCPQHAPGDNALIATDQIYLQPSSLGIETIVSDEVRVLNPFDGSLEISFEKSADRTILLYDLKGAVVYSESSCSKEVSVDTRHVQKGMYILSIQEGAKVYQKKLIK
jgi:hypothetical protein